LNEAKIRETLVKQKIEQRLLSAKKVVKLDIDKCPLLTKPSELYMKNVGLNNTTTMTTTTNKFVKNNVATLSKLNPAPPKITNGSSRRTTSLLRLIYANTTTNRYCYEHLKILEHVADIFMCFSLFDRSKLMTHFAFRSFIK
jgi:hypothetical protein